MNPNPLNHASLEACQRLVEAGIVLETEKYWYQDAHGWYLGLMPTVKGQHTPAHIPAPSMAEVWRELPRNHPADGDDFDDGTGFLDIGKDHDGKTWASYELCGKRDEIEFGNTNPADALIDLLIWVRKEQAK